MSDIQDDFSDVFNANRFASSQLGKMIYVPQRGSWMQFDGVCWQSDELRLVMQHAIRVTKDMAIEAGKLLIEAALSENKRLQERAEALSKHARNSQAKPRLEALLGIAATDPRLAVSQSQLDNQDMVFAAKNGVLDLGTGAFREAKPQDYLSKSAGCEWQGGWEDVECRAWTKFLEEVQPDPDVRGWLQRFAGYCLTGRTDEQIFTVFQGSGANGKSVFVETIKKVLGDYAVTAQFDTFCDRGNDQGIRNDLARLDKVRLVAASEGQDGARLDEGIIKQITGQDEITARFLHREFFSFRPKFKVVLVTNHKPVVTGTDHGIWRRIVLVPWPVTIPTEKRDRRLQDRLENELPGILAWCMQGLKSYLEVGLQELPAALIQANTSYRKDSDLVGIWLDDRCEIDPAATSTASDIYFSYTSWATSNGHRPMSQTSLGHRLAERGYSQSRNKSVRGWRGIKVLLPLG